MYRKLNVDSIEWYNAKDILSDNGIILKEDDTIFASTRSISLLANEVTYVIYDKDGNNERRCHFINNRVKSIPSFSNAMKNSVLKHMG